MTIHLLNCFTDNARWPGKLKTGMVCLLIESDQGLILLDTGLGLDDYASSHPDDKIVPFDHSNAFRSKRGSGQSHQAIGLQT